MVQNLPTNWKWVKVSEIANTKSGGTPRRSHPEYFNGDIPWIKSGELEDGYIRRAEEYITNSGLENSNTTIFQKGTVIVAMYGATVGKVGILDIDAATNQAVCAIFPIKNSFITKYMFYWIISQRDSLLKQRIGGAQPNISQSIIRSQNFPLSPIDKQKQIVSKIEELFSQLDAGVAGLKRAQAELKRYRASILKAAFEGRLVPQDPNDEPACELVKKVNIDPKKLEKTKSLPDSWALVKIDDIADTSSGGTPLRSKPEYFDGEIPWIKSGELRDNIIKDSEEKITSLGLDESSAKIFAQGTTIVALYGATVGRTGILDIDAATNQAVCAVIPKQNIIISKYLFYWLQHQRSHLLNLRVGGAQPNISQRIIRALEFPLSPSNEQNRIVIEIERLLSIIENIEHMINTGIEMASKLGQVILKSAFSGKLISKTSSEILSGVLSNGNNKNANQKNDSIIVQGKLF